jgi:lipoprotein NlpI
LVIGNHRTVLEEVRRGASDKERGGRLSDTDYYPGEERLWKGDPTGAQELFRKSLETNETNSDGYRASKAMLARVMERGAGHIDRASGPSPTGGRGKRPIVSANDETTAVFLATGPA